MKRPRGLGHRLPSSTTPSVSSVATSGVKARSRVILILDRMVGDSADGNGFPITPTTTYSTVRISNFAV